MVKFIFAFCWANGAIGFGASVPKGAIGIARGPSQGLRNVIAATSRLAYDNKTLLVPGVPEAPDQRTGVDALHTYMKWLCKRERPGIKVFLQEVA